MTVRALHLESFDAVTGAAAPPHTAETSAADEARESERLASYESGYRSGWDDCQASEDDTTRRVGAELARNLADLGFTYHEARAQLLAETEALLKAFFRTVLPSSIGPVVARWVVDDVLELAAGALDLPVEIVASPADAATVRLLLPDTVSFPLTLVEEDALAEGQVHLRLGRSERAYDLSGLADRFCEAIAARTSEPLERKENNG